MTDVARPVITPDTAPFWEGLAAGELRLRRCLDCGHVWHPARWICPECLSENLEWIKSAGEGRVESFVWYLQHMPPVPAGVPDPPYCVAVVELDEGAVLWGIVEEVDFGEIAVGDRVGAAYRQVADDLTLLRFVPT